MPSGYIDDGYTIEATIEGKDGEYDGIEIEYRPLLRKEMWRHSQAVTKAKENEDLEKIDELVAELVVQKVISWTLFDRNGKSVPLTAENVLRLHTDLFNQLILIIMRSKEQDNTTAKNL